MKDDPIPPEHNISRYCGGGSLLSNGEVSGASFMLREDEPYLSVNWLEHLNLSDRSAEIAEIRRVLATKLTVGKTAKIAILKVGQVQGHVRRESPDQRALRILHRPDEPPELPDPSHSGIFDMKLDDKLIADLIAQTVTETHSAR